MRLAWAVLALLPLVPAKARAAQEPETRARQILAGSSVHERIGPIETPLSTQLADFLLDHPDLAASIVREHGIAPYVISMRGPRQSWADDGDGTVGLITETVREDGRRVYYGDGTHHSRLFPDIRAEAVIVMEMGPQPRRGCSEHVRSTFEVYVRLRNPVLARMVSVLPFVRKTIVRKFSKAFLVADQVGRLIAKTPQAVVWDVRDFGLPEAEEARALGLIGALTAQPLSCRD